MLAYKVIIINKLFWPKDKNEMNIFQLKKKNNKTKLYTMDSSSGSCNSQKEAFPDYMAQG